MNMNQRHTRSLNSNRINHCYHTTPSIICRTYDWILPSALFTPSNTLLLLADRDLMDRGAGMVTTV